MLPRKHLPGAAFRSQLAALCIAAAFAPAARALVATDLPPEQRQGTVTFRSGGIGEDEAKAMQEAAAQYPVEFEFVVREGDGHGAWLSDVALSVRDAQGKPVLETQSTGPLLLAKLPPGRYVVAARNGDSERTRRIDVPARGKPQHVVFAW